MHGARLQRAEARGAQQQRHDVRRHNVRRGAQPPPALEGQPGGGAGRTGPEQPPEPETDLRRLGRRRRGAGRVQGGSHGRPDPHAREREGRHHRFPAPAAGRGRRGQEKRRRRGQERGGHPGGEAPPAGEPRPGGFGDGASAGHPGARERRARRPVRGPGDARVRAAPRGGAGQRPGRAAGPGGAQRAATRPPPHPRGVDARPGGHHPRDQPRSVDDGDAAHPVGSVPEQAREGGRGRQSGQPGADDRQQVMSARSVADHKHFPVAQRRILACRVALSKT
mmetsp:Transcript_6946/g.19668  ORF Transcript_6946/g.19668 Transcript_6946/m.19668 type:complete len:280 (-) Transcript_6946:1090-1929(-)